MPIDPNSISWDSTPKVAPHPSSIAWDDGPPATPTVKATPANYDDGSYNFNNTSGILGWLQSADRMSGRGANRLVAGLDRLGQGVSQNVGLPQVADWFGSQAKTNEQGAAAPVPGAVTWDDVKAHPGVGTIASYIGQSALGATPDLAAVTVNPLLYAASREGDIAHTRAMNNRPNNLSTLIAGQQPDVAPSWTDMALAAPTAAIDTGLMKYGLGGILGGEGYGIVKGTLRAAGRDAIMGAGQPVVDQMGERLGTNKDIDWNEAGDQALAGAVGMAPFGAAAHLGVRGVRAIGKGEEAGPSPDVPQTVRQQLSPEQADALTLHGIDVDTLEDANMARKAADRLLAKTQPAAEAPPVIATRHGNVAPNADAQGRDFGTIDRNSGTERQKFENKVIGVESGGDDNAKNTRSSASGRAQFTDDTFVRTYQRRFGTGESRESILAKKNDPRLQTVLMRDLTNANEDVLRRSGVPLTSGNYYLAHFAGAGGAVKLHRNLDAPVEQVLGQKAVDANPFLKGMTGRDVIDWAAHKMGEAGHAPMAGGHMVDYPVRPSERPDDTLFRGPDHSNVDSTEAYGFDPIERGQRLGQTGAHDTGNMGEGDGGGRQSKLLDELNQPGARGEGMATGGMGRPFKADASEHSGMFEDVQRIRTVQAEAATEKRWQQRKAEAERMKADFEEARRNRAGQNDASAKYQQFGSKPHYDPDRGHFRTTDDGFVADEGGNPVVWPSQGAAAKWAARFKMGGDFELQAHGTSKRGGEQPVTLQRKPGSDYGQAKAEEAPRPNDGAAPQLEHIQWHDEPAAQSEDAPPPASDRQAPPADKFPGDYTPEEAANARAQRTFENAKPEHPGREPKKPTSFFSDVASHLASEKQRTGQTVKISAEDAVNHGVPADAIYHNPKDAYPTIKANAAKVFASEKAPLNSRGKPVRTVPLDYLGDRFRPEDYGAPRGDGVQEHRLAPEHAGDLLRRSMEGDDSARNQAHPQYAEHKAWAERMDALDRFTDEFGDDWTKLTDEQLAKLDPGAFDAFYDDVLRAADKPDVDPFDPRFWENEGEQPHQGEAAETGGRSGEDTGRAERDSDQSDNGAQGHENGGRLYRGGEPAEVSKSSAIYRTTSRAAAESYIDRNNPNHRLEAFDGRLDNPAPESEAIELARKYIGTEFERVPASMFDSAAWGAKNVNALIAALRKRGYDGVIFGEGSDRHPNWERAETHAFFRNEGGHGHVEASKDFFGERDGDQRRALERKGEEPLRGKKEQKAPGSDGGLFDDGSHREQGTLFHKEGDYHDPFRESPTNKIPREVLRDGMEVDRALHWVSENSGDEFHKELADRLIDLTEGVTLHTFDGSKRAASDLGERLKATHGAVVHDGGQARIFLNSRDVSYARNGLTEETLLHEAIHAAIATRIGTLRGEGRRNPGNVEAARGYGQDIRRLNVLAKSVRAELVRLYETGEYKRRDGFGLETMQEARIASENIDEFVTYALTSREFQRMLQGIELPDTYGQTTRLTAWQHFVNVARRIVGLDPKYQAEFVKLLDANNALDAFGETVNPLLDRLDETKAVKQDKQAQNDSGMFEAERQGFDRRSGDDRREFGRRGEPDRRVIRASDAGLETREDRNNRVREDNERRRVDSRTSRVVAGAKALLNDENGSLNIDKVAKFFVDLDTMRDAKDGMKKLGVALRSSTPKEILAKSLDTGRMGGRVVASYFHSIDARLRGLGARFDSPTIHGLADMFHARAGRDDKVSETYHEAVAHNSRRWNRSLYKSLEVHAKDAAALERIRNIITKTGSGSVEERAAAAEVAKLLKTIHDYRRDAGEDIGEVADGYFPRMLNPDAVVKGEAEFKQKAAQLFVQAGETPKDAAAKADMWFHQVVNENAGLDGAILDVRRAKAPGTTSGLSRKLGKDADAVLEKFYQKDPLDVLQAYITGSVKRAEFTRRFGVPGREGSTERANWQSQHGHKDQLDVIRDKINKEILASGKEPGDAQQLINDILEANLGILGKSSTSFRLGISLAHGYNQIAKMDHSLITSFNELAMGFVRHGPVGGIKFLGNTVKEFARELLKMPPSEARRYAEHLGMVLDAGMDQTLQSRISAVEGTKGVNKVVSRFYRTIGLHQFTEGERVAASKMAREQINALVGDLDSTNVRTVRRAERALHELGIDDPQALKQWLGQRSGKPTFAEIDANKGMASKWSTAVARMTNQTVMEPTRAVKPLWANHPLGSLLYGLMSYSFAFKKNVMDRAANLAWAGVKERDIHHFMPLLFGLPVLAAFTYLNDTYLRPALFGSSYDFAHETAPMAVLRAADRASMDGALSPLVNTIFGTKYQRSLSEAFIGSFAGSALQGAENIVVKPMQAKMNGTDSNAAARGQAGAIYDLFIEPAVDAAAVATVGGKLATGVVYASGSRPGSIFPQDREAFIDGLAGPLNTTKAKDPFNPGKSDFDKAFDKADAGAKFDKAFKKATGG